MGPAASADAAAVLWTARAAAFILTLPLSPGCRDFGGPPPGWGGPRRGDSRSPPPRERERERDERPDLLRMSYEDYLARFRQLKQTQVGAGPSLLPFAPGCKLGGQSEHLLCILLAACWAGMVPWPGSTLPGCVGWAQRCGRHPPHLALSLSLIRPQAPAPNPARSHEGAMVPVTRRRPRPQRARRTAAGLVRRRQRRARRRRRRREGAAAALRA